MYILNNITIRIQLKDVQVVAMRTLKSWKIMSSKADSDPEEVMLSLQSVIVHKNLPPTNQAV